MKESAYEVISTFRKKITSLTYIYLLLIIAAIITMLLIKWEQRLFYTCIYTACFFLVLLAIRLMMRRSKMLSLLDPDSPRDSFEKMESYLKEKRAELQSVSTPRLLIGLVLFAAFLYFFFVDPHTVGTGILFICFLALVIDSMITHWLLMIDSMRMQDLRHVIHNDHSEIS